MALARTIIALAPLILNARSRRPGKRLASVIFSAIFMALAGLSFLVAAFVWVMKSFGAEFGFLAVGIVLFIAANIIYFVSRDPKAKLGNVEAQPSEDPLAQYIPVDLQNDPSVKALMEKIKEHPMGATAAAVSLGFIISHQIFGE